ncbi:hypothetical protein BaRGS_00017130 [Batillaria attramentaria]|uniref:Uncharacterized protein n=1 Tax=Batillaria attramentaria TaxID=370345 RepID=A0ABD0KX48_9CAEN
MGRVFCGPNEIPCSDSEGELRGSYIAALCFFKTDGNGHVTYSYWLLDSRDYRKPFGLYDIRLLRSDILSVPEEPVVQRSL